MMGATVAKTWCVDTLLSTAYRSVAPHRGFMLRKSYTAEEFTPSEAEQVTGVSTALQRDWRRRGLLKQSRGSHARYTAAELAELVLMKDFSDEKLGPKLLSDIMAMSAWPLSDWVHAISWTHTSPERCIPADQLPARYVVYSGDHVWRTSDLNAAFEGLAADHDRRFGFVCDLRSVAAQVIKRLPRPVWRVGEAAAQAEG